MFDFYFLSTATNQTDFISSIIRGNCEAILLHFAAIKKQNVDNLMVKQAGAASVVSMLMSHPEQYCGLCRNLRK